MSAPRRRFRAVAAACLAVLGIGLSVQPAHASDDALSWSVQPANNDNGTGRPNFGYTMDPGQSLRDAIVVTNNGDEQLSLAMVAADAFTTSTGQLDLLPSGAVSTDVGAWVTIDSPTITLAPGASTEVGFTVTVPRDAAPGDHTGGVVTSYVSAQAGTTVALDRRLGSRMHIRVSGALTPALTVSGVHVSYDGTFNPFGTSAATVDYTVTNTGNTRLAATAAVTVAGPSGWAQTASPLVNLPELLPGASTHQKAEVTGVWPLLRATATVELLPVVIGSDASIAPVQGRSTTWAVPWVLLIIVLLVIGGAAAGAVMRTRTKPAMVKSGATTSEPEESLSDN